jgi:hypothetical protein
MLIVIPEAVGDGGGRSNAPPPSSPQPYILADPWIFHLKDDVTVFLLLHVFNTLES